MNKTSTQKRGDSKIEFVQKLLTFVLWNWLTGSRSLLIWQRAHCLLGNNQKRNHEEHRRALTTGHVLSASRCVWPSRDPRLTAPLSRLSQRQGFFPVHTPPHRPAWGVTTVGLRRAHFPQLRHPTVWHPAPRHPTPPSPFLRHSSGHTTYTFFQAPWPQGSP